MGIQRDRNVTFWHSMYDLIINSNAASLYVQSFLDRKRNAKEWAKDMDDGTAESQASPSPTRARQSGFESLPTKASTQSVRKLSNASLNADFSSAAQPMKVSNRIPDSMACPDKKAF